MRSASDASPRPEGHPGRRRPVELGLRRVCEGAPGLCKPIAKRRARAANARIGSASALAPPTAPFYLRVWVHAPSRPRARQYEIAPAPGARCSAPVRAYAHRRPNC